MAWKVSCVMDERKRFVEVWSQGEFSVAELCRQFGVSRKTGYKWLDRYRRRGWEGLEDLSRAAHGHPNEIAAELVERVVAFKGEHMLFGPKKIVARLRASEPDTVWPAVSTAGDILKRAGLVVSRERRRRATPSSAPLAHADAPNALWCADFKGWFRTRDGTCCIPLTISDACTRYFLRCRAMTGHTGYASVRPLFEAAFREFGLPGRIRTDNGPPFASVGLAGLSRLSVWWMKLGIAPERIEPGHPEQNGRHERLHRTLKEATARPPAATVRTQQGAFDRFLPYYNHERPHEALGQKTPASIYTKSPRPYPARVPTTGDYPDPWTVRKVKDSGRLKWKGRELHLSQALIGEYVGFEPVDDRRWVVHFLHQPIALFDEHRLRFTPSKVNP